MSCQKLGYLLCEYSIAVFPRNEAKFPRKVKVKDEERTDGICIPS